MKFLDINLIESLSHSRGYIKSQRISLDGNWPEVLINQITKVQIIDNKKVAFSFTPEFSTYCDDDKLAIYLSEFGYVRYLLWNEICITRGKIVLHYDNKKYILSDYERVTKIARIPNRSFEVQFADKTILFIENS